MLKIKTKTAGASIHISTTDNVSSTPFHSFLSFAALMESPTPRPVFSLTLSSNFVFCLSLFLSLSPAVLSWSCQSVLLCGNTI